MIGKGPFSLVSVLLRHFQPFGLWRKCDYAKDGVRKSGVEHWITKKIDRVLVDMALREPRCCITLKETIVRGGSRGPSGCLPLPSVEVQRLDPGL